MFSENDILIIRKLGQGFVIMKGDLCAPDGCDSYTAAERLQVDILENDKEIAAFTNAGDMIWFLARLYGIRFTEELESNLIESTSFFYEETEPFKESKPNNNPVDHFNEVNKMVNIHIKPETSSKKKVKHVSQSEKKKTRNIGVFGENLRTFVNVSAEIVATGKKPKKEKNIIDSICENTTERKGQFQDMQTKGVIKKTTLSNSFKSIQKLDTKKNQTQNLLQKELIGWWCNDCGELYEEKPDRCFKCNSHAIEELEKEKLLV